MSYECRPGETASLTRHPGHIDRLDSIDRRNQTSERRVPTSYDEINFCLRRKPSRTCNRIEYHHKIADSLEPQQKDSLWWLGGLRWTKRRSEERQRAKAGIGQPDKPSFITIRNLQMLKH